MAETSPEHLSESLGRELSIDALRGLAALSVLVYHARELLWVGLGQTYHTYGLRPNFSAWVGYLSAPFTFGNLGVTLFFVLSGYCIHRRGAFALAKDARASLDLGSFARRRFWRIYPTYCAAMILTAAVDWVVFHHTGARLPGQDDSPFAFLVSLATLQGYVAPFFGSNGVFWTLALEVHLYLAYPLLFFLSRRFGPGKTLLFTLAVALIYSTADAWWGISRHFPYRSQRGPIFLPFWFTWTAGFYIAEIEAGRARVFPPAVWRGAMIAGFLGGLPLLMARRYDFAELFWAPFFAGVLHWSLALRGKRVGWEPLEAGLAFVGVFSYSLYAIHVPSLEIYQLLLSPAAAHKFTTIWPAIGGVFFALICAWIFFSMIERWSIRRRIRPARG